MMSDRVIRDELLTSERYWSVSIEAQRLFVHLILVVDDSARFSGKNYTIALSCFPGHSISDDKLESLLAELLDRDLIRMYMSGGERYVFLPRFRQRQRYCNSKYPAPPREITDLLNGKSDLSQTQARPESDSSPPSVAVAVAVPASVAVPVSVSVSQKRSSSVEPKNPGLSAAAPPSVISIPLNDKTDFQITQAQVDEWAQLYPSCDVPQTLREIRGWNLANAAKRKTRGGILKHINAWLSKEQNGG